MPSDNFATQNRLLLALPRKEFERVKPKLETVVGNYRDTLVEVDGALDHVYFPDAGVISIIAVYPDGKTVELATIGREGCTGFQALLGAKTSSVRLLVQIAGTSARMTRHDFVHAAEHNPVFRKLMYSYLHAFLEQILISGGCNGAHSIRERLARWILMMRDRSESDDLPITQDLLAEMLGVHRPTITNAVQALQDAGLIDVGRRRVSIRNRDGLLGASCECYLIVRTRTASHLPRTYID